MTVYNYLPGVQVTTLDGGLAARRTPTAKATLIIGTSATGPANQPYQVTDRATASLLFGFSGTITRAMEEVALGGDDNIILYRMGATPATLANVGKNLQFTTSATITNVARAGTLVTILCSNTFSVGDSVAVTATTNVSVNGTFTLLSANSTTITFNDTTSGTIASGADTGTVIRTTAAVPGFSISFNADVSATSGTDYSIWYKLGVLYVWNGTQLVFANDTGNSVVVNTNDISITGTITGSTGLPLGTSTASLTNAITLVAAGALSASPPNVVVVYTPAVTGLGLTGRQTYIAMRKAFDLLDIYPVDQIIVPDAVFDQPNVAFYVSSNAATVANNPATNSNALDWLLTTTDAFGNRVYQWASETTNSAGATVSIMSGSLTTGALRKAAGWSEVHFPHSLGMFCQYQEQVGMQGTCLGFIGTSQPNSFSLVDLRSWIGYLPVYNPLIVDQDGNADLAVTTDGFGLLALPLLAGCTGARLNSLCLDSASGRAPGFFQTADLTYDGATQIDANGNPIDVGAYVHVVADIGVLADGFSLGYGANLANYAAGYCSGLDEKNAMTNKPVNVTQLWRPNSLQMNSATFIGINLLRFKGTNNLPSWLHDQTAAHSASDYKNLLRQRIKGLVVDTLRITADPFIGSSSIDGLQIQAMQTALTNKLNTLQKRGYISTFSFSITTTPADQRIGHATININFNPADELVQLNAVVGISRS